VDNQFLDERLSNVENSVIFRAARWAGATAAGLSWKLRGSRGSGHAVDPVWYRELQEIEKPPPGVAVSVPSGYKLVVHADDTLEPHAISSMAAEAVRTGADLIYADEDWIDPSGARRDPVFKPDWSPELYASCRYTGRSYMAREEAPDPPRTAAHINQVLIHSRSRLVPQAGAAPAAHTPHASIVICSRNGSLLRRCLKSLERTRYPSWEVIAVLHHLDVKLEGRVRGVPYHGPFHWPRMNNLGVRESRGEVVVLLNDDIVVKDRDWLSRMTARLAGESVGAVGALLLYPNGSIQHAGIVTGMMDACGHPGRGQFETPAWPYTLIARNVSAVTGACLAVRRKAFEQVGGLDDAFPVNYNDVDFCLRLIRAGYRNVFEPRAVLRHDECQTRRRGTSAKERALFHGRWAQVLSRPDPYYPIYFRRDCEAVALRPVLDLEELAGADRNG